MTVQELKDWEGKLKREQTDWQSRRSELEREIRRLNATLDVLVEKLEAKQHSFESLTTDTEALGATYTQLLDAKATIEAEIGLLEGKKTVATASVNDLNALVKSKTASIDAGLGEYEAEQRKLAEERLDELRLFSREAEATLSELATQTAGKRDELDGLRQALVTARDELERQEAATKARLEALSGQESDLLRRIGELEPEVAKLMHERDTAVSAALKARQEHEQFTKYERTAWAALNTKDKELQDKQAELDVEERHLNARRSFLPKL